MNAYIKNKILISIALICLVCASIFGFAAVRHQPAGVSAAVTEVDGQTLSLNVNDGKRAFTAKELYLAVRPRADIDVNDAMITYQPIDDRDSLPYSQMDDILLNLSYAGDTDTFSIEPKDIGQADFKVRISVFKNEVLASDCVYKVRADITAGFPKWYPGTSDPIEKNTPIECVVSASSAYILTQGIKTTIDFLSDPTYTADIASMISLSETMRNQFGVRSFAGARITGVRTEESSSVLTIDQSKVDGVNLNFEAVLVGNQPTVSIIVDFSFGDDSAKLIVEFILTTKANSNQSTITLKSLEQLTQTVYGSIEREIEFVKLFDDIGTGKLYLDDSAVVTYNNAVMEYERIVVEDKTVGVKLRSKANGFTSMNFSLRHCDANGTYIGMVEASLPVEVKGIYDRTTRDAVSQNQLLITASDFGTAGQDGYVFDEILENSDGKVANAKVENGKLVIMPGVEGASIIKVYMYNPLVGKQIYDPLTAKYLDSRIVMELSVNVKPYSFFESLSDTGYIVFGTIAGILVLVILYLVISTIVKCVVGAKRKKEFEKEAAKKLAYKKEIADKQKAQQMAMMRAMNPVGAMPPQPVLGLAGGMGPGPAGAPFLAIGGAVTTPQKTKATMMLLTDGAITETRAPEIDKEAQLEGSKKAEDFIKEAEEKARRAAEESKFLKRKQKDDEKTKRRGIETANRETPGIDAEINELMRSNNELKKAVFARDYDIKMFDESKKEITEKLPTATTENEISAYKAQLEDISAKTTAARSELQEKEQALREGTNAQSEKQKTLIDMMKDYEELDAKAKEYAERRAAISKDLDEEYEKFKTAYVEEASNRRMLENVERMQDEMKRQQEKKRQEELNQLIAAKLAALDTISADIDRTESLDELEKIDAKINGYEANLTDSEKVTDVLSKLTAVRNVSAKRRGYLEELDKKQALEREEDLKKKTAEVMKLNAGLIEAYRKQIETDKQLFVLESSRTKSQALIKKYSQELTSAETEAESAKLTALIEAENEKLGKIKGEIFQIESTMDAEAEAGSANQNRMMALINEYHLTDLKKDLEHKNEIAQRDLQADYDRFVADYKDELARREQLEEAERVRRQLKEKEEQAKREKLAAVVKAQTKAVSNLIANVKLATSSEQLSRLEADLNDSKEELSTIEVPHELSKLVADANIAIGERREELNKMNAEELQAAKKKQEREQKLAEMAAKVRSKALRVKAQIVDIKTREDAEKLLNTLDEIEESVPEKMRTDNVLMPVEKCRMLVRHAGDIADVKNRKPKKKIVHNVVKSAKKPTSGGAAKSSGSKSAGKSAVHSKKKAGGTKSGVKKSGASKSGSVKKTVKKK